MQDGKNVKWISNFNKLHNIEGKPGPRSKYRSFHFTSQLLLHLNILKQNVIDLWSNKTLPWLDADVKVWELWKFYIQ